MRKLLLIIFLTLFGLGIGLVVGALLMRRVDRAAQRYSPRSAGARAATGASDLRERFRAAIEAGAAAAAAKEAELRERFDVPTIEEAAATTRDADEVT